MAGYTIYYSWVSHKSLTGGDDIFQTWRSCVSQTGYLIFPTWRSHKFDTGYSIFRQWRSQKSKNGHVIFPNMETILILEWIFYLPSLENGNNILFWIIYYPKLYFLLILSWILQFPFLSSPGYISVPGLEFFLTLTGYFLINQTWGNCIFSKLGFFLKSRKYPGENQVKTGLDFSHFFLCSVKILRK